MIHSHGLRYQYPGGPLLAFADVAVPQGGVLLVSGPSGCGKSTWLALVVLQLKMPMMQPESFSDCLRRGLKKR